VSRRLGSDGDLSTQQAAVTVRLAINKVPQIWKDGHVTLGALWELYCQYPYMPRLRDRKVLQEGVRELPLIWETDAFALATGYQDGRYVGLWIPGDANSAPVATDSLLLVRPDVATKQRAEEEPAPESGDPSPSPTKPQPAKGPGVDVGFPPAKTRFYGVKTLSSDKIALDFKNIADEVIANLRDQGIELVVRIEIEAVDSNGFDENKIRTVAENAKTLKFDQSGFEES
jgi:hypothetical protein